MDKLLVYNSLRIKIKPFVLCLIFLKDLGENISTQIVNNRHKLPNF